MSGPAFSRPDSNDPSYWGAGNDASTQQPHGDSYGQGPQHSSQEPYGYGSAPEVGGSQHDGFPPYSDQGYAGQGYADQGYAGQGYADQRYAGQGYGADAYPPPAYPATQYPQMPYAAPRPTNALAIISLCCSLGTLMTGFSWIIGIITGHIALRQIERTGEQGRGLALAGLIIGYVSAALVLMVIAIYVIVIVAAIGSTY